MTRALRFLALFSALFVVTVRGLGGVPCNAGRATPTAAEATQVNPASDEPRERDALAAIDLDDSDDDVDAVVAPSPVRIRLLTYGAALAGDGGALTAERALPSHAPSLDRPPRA